MNWLKKIIVRWAMNDDHSMLATPSLSVKRDTSIDSYGFNLKVYKASGGTVIETSAYDRNRDRHHTGLYVITDDKDLGTEISKIITMENLKT
jgi:hypothetical protein